MDKIKFLMTDTGAQTTQLCRQALEAKGIDVTVWTPSRSNSAMKPRIPAAATQRSL